MSFLGVYITLQKHCCCLTHLAIETASGFLWKKIRHQDYEQHYPIELSTVMEVVYVCTAQCSSHWPCAGCPLETCLLGGGNWIFYFILITLNLSSHMWLLATVLDSVATGSARDAAKELTSWGVFSGKHWLKQNPRDMLTKGKFCTPALPQKEIPMQRAPLSTYPAPTSTKSPW